MANVIKCDACGSIIETSESKFLRIHSVTESNRLDKCLCKTDICDDCYKKIINMFNIIKEEK